MGIVALQGASARVPHLDRVIFGARNHPFPFAVESNTGDIVGVALKGHDRIWVSRFDVIQLDIAVASGCQVALIRRDAEAVDLGVRMLDGTRTDTRQCFPKADKMQLAGSPSQSAWLLKVLTGWYGHTPLYVARCDGQFRSKDT